MRLSFVGALLVLAASAAVHLSSFTPAIAQADKFDGEWLAKGDVSCTPKGADSFEAVVTILNSQLSGKLRGVVRDYEISGTIGPAGRLSAGHLYSVLLGYNPVLGAVGKFGANKGNISYLGAGAAGAYCGGDMNLTRLPSKEFEETPVSRDLTEDASLARAEIVQRLRTLKDMENSGIISSEEAAQKRVEILKSF